MNPDPDVPLAASDLFLSPDLTEERAWEDLASRGFGDPVAADRHLQSMADDLAAREALGALAGDLLDALAQAPDPDAALARLAGYASARASKLALLRYLKEDLRALDVLAQVLGTSPILAEILLRNPEYFHWLMQQLDRSAPDKLAYTEEFDAALVTAEGVDARLDALRRFKRRDLLRIATRDIVGQETLESATLQLSDLADALVSHALELAWEHCAPWSEPPGAFAVVGLGMAGGRELSYRSALDVLYIYDTQGVDDPSAHDLFQQLGNRLSALMTEQTGEGFLYRAEVRPGPTRSAQDVAYSLDAWQRHYATGGGPLERFDLLKARPMAGDLALGQRFISAVQRFVHPTHQGVVAVNEMIRSNARMARALSHATGDHLLAVCRSGARDVELMVQMLQLTYGEDRPELWEPNTLEALATMANGHVIPVETADALAGAYMFFRRVGHRAELMQDADTGAPDSARQLTLYARALGLASTSALDAELHTQRDRVRAIYSSLVEPEL